MILSNTFTRKKQKNEYGAPGLFFLCPFVLFVTPLFFGCSTASYTVSSYNVDFDRLPAGFDGFKIVIIADLHSHSFGKNQEKLTEGILELAPDIVVLAGDIIDRHDKDISNVRALLAGISGMFPVYAIAGNHEFENPVQFKELLNAYREYGVIFLDGDTVTIKREEDLIAVSSQKLYPRQKGKYWIGSGTAPIFNNKFNIFLHHFGNEFDLISDEYDLVISGHGHGGLIRIFGKGLFSNKAFSLFPRYSKGVYRKESGSVMVMSAGLGNAAIPRINNPRELVMVILKAVEKP